MNIFLADTGEQLTWSKPQRLDIGSSFELMVILGQFSGLGKCGREIFRVQALRLYVLSG